MKNTQKRLHLIIVLYLAASLSRCWQLKFRRLGQREAKDDPPPAKTEGEAGWLDTGAPSSLLGLGQAGVALAEMTADWHVVFTDSGHERRAASDLCCLDGVQGFCPSARARWWSRGRIVHRAIPLISRTIFARWDEDPHLWHAIKDTIHVRRIMGDANPVIVRDETFELWWSTADDEWCIPSASVQLAYLRRGYWKGSSVVINHRFLRGVHGVVERIDENTLSAFVSYTMLGRAHQLRCPLTALSAAEADPEQFVTELFAQNGAAAENVA